jgi:hypothetical protein
VAPLIPRNMSLLPPAHISLGMPRSQMTVFENGTVNPEPGTVSPEPGTVNPEPGTPNPEPGTE